METYRLFAFLFLLTGFIACEEQSFEIQPSNMEVLSQKWRLNSLNINGFEINEIDSSYEYNIQTSARWQLSLKKFIYKTGGTYLVDWVRRGEYNLGTPEDPNWQPRIGYYVLDWENQKIIHNSGQPYEAEYSIDFLSGNRLERSSMRYMSRDDENTNRNGWSRGDIVPFVEIYILDE